MIGRSVCGAWTRSSGEYACYNQLDVHGFDPVTTNISCIKLVVLRRRLNAAKVLIAGSGGLVAEVCTTASGSEFV